MHWVIDAPPIPSVPVVGGGLFPVRRIFCVGRNYADHAIEMGATGREPPFFFMKPADAVRAEEEGGELQLPYPTLTGNFHHEVELVVALGAGGRDISVEAAPRHIFGHAIGLDMTRRDLQNTMKQQGRPWEIGKSFEASAPMGPIHPWSPSSGALTGTLELSVNGTLRQRGQLSDLIWSVNETIAILSQAWELAAGDLIFTGTPAGVGPVVLGDVMEASISGLGALRVRVVRAETDN
jgi:fumarylpyruvate hydrolase